MKAAVLHAPGNLRIEEIPVPQPDYREVLVQVNACGICGTDMHTLAGNNPLARYPVIPGHEFVGTVVEVGRSVDVLQSGDRVAVDPSRSCGRCFHCRSGWPNLCPDKGGHGSRVPGGFAEYVVARQEACVLLDPELSFVRAAFSEPLACVLHGMDRLGSVLGKRAVVYGAGPIGMLTAALLVHGGAQVQIVELAASRRRIAAKWNIQAAESAEELAERDGWDVAVDATGVPEAIENAFSNVRRAGTMLLLGVAPADKTIKIEPFKINWHEITIIGSMAIRHSFQRAVELLPQLRLPIETLVTHEILLSDLQKGIDLVRSRDAMKVLVSPSAKMSEE
ncbi:MAG: zinc-dependent alcohol dehydrogenase family protein [Alphaproteobacteria bacterium]